MAAKATDWLLTQLKQHKNADGSISCTSPDTAVLMGLVRRQYLFTPVQTLKADTDFRHRIPKHQWWLKLRPLLRILAKHDSSY